MRIDLSVQSWPRSGFSRLGRLVLWSVLALAGNACSDGASSTAVASAPGGLELRGAGSTFAAPVIDRWADAYRQAHATRRLTYEPVGSGEGVRRFLGEGSNPSATIDFAVSDSPLTDSQLARTQGQAAMIPVTAGCIVLAYRLPDLPKTLNLPRDVYVDMFLGRIDRWNDVRIARANPGVRLPSLAIGRVVRQDASGTTAAFTSHLSAISQSWRDQVGSGTHVNWPGTGVITGKGNEGVAGLIRNFEGMIGYVGYEFAHKLDLNMAALENHSGRVVQASPDTCGAAVAAAVVPEDLRILTPDPAGDDAYPIVTFSWLLLRRDGPDRERSSALRDFVRWSLETGQNQVAALGYVKLPATVTARALQVLDGAVQTASH